MKKKYVIFVLIALVIVALACFFVFSGNEEEGDNKQSIEKYVDAEVASIKLRKELDKNSTYPDFHEYFMQAGGDSNALTEANDIIVKQEALRWYAKEQNLKVTSKDVDKIVDDLINTQNDKKYQNKDIQSACDKYDIDFSYLINNERCIYARQCYANVVYEKFFGDGKEDIPVDDMELLKSKWDDKVSDIISLYKKTSYYRELDKALKLDSELAEDKVLDAKKIKAVDIPVEGYFIDL